MELNIRNIENFVSERPEAPFDKLFEGIQYPWDALANIPAVFDEFFAGQLSNSSAFLHCMDYEPGGGISVKKTKRITTPLIDKTQKIYIGEGCYLETGAMIKPYTVILGHCEIRQSSYLRGNLFVNANCILGHTTELKNSILINHVEAGHFVYVGDSVVGSYVNLGAGAKLSNLPFRTFDEKRMQKFPLIDLKFSNEIIQHNLSKFGAVISDGCELGCNSVTAPGVVMGKDSWVYPTCFVAKGEYPAKTIFKACKLENGT